MKIKPLFDKVVVEGLKAEEKTKIFKGVFKLDFFCNSNAVVSDKRCAELLVQHNVSD